MPSGKLYILTALGLALLVGGCDSEDSVNPADAGGPGLEDSGQDAGLGDSPIQPAMACDDDLESLYGDPGELPDEKGAIIRCNKGEFIDRATLDARLKGFDKESQGYAGAAPSGGVRLYRVLYRTERGDGRPGSSVATIYLPEKPRAEKVPLVLLARGSRGQAPACAPSQTTDGPIDRSDNRDGRHVQLDHEATLWPLVVAGFAVVSTDSAGYANHGAPGNPPSGYADAADMARSFIDSAHALKNLVPDATTDELLMVGLSQGGHTVLSAVQEANTYAAPGPILGAAVYAPLWFSQRGWGVAITAIAEATGITIATSSAVTASIWYHYTHAELYDGPGEGVKIFKPEMRDRIKTFVDEICWSEEYTSLTEGGLITAKDFFEADFISSAGEGAGARSCGFATDKELCEKWLARYNADHPTFTDAASAVPILITYGLQDTAISPPRVQCGIDKLRAGGSPLEFCIDPDAGHVGVALRRSDYVSEWLASKAFGDAITGSCPSNAAPEGLTCDPLLPND